MAFKTGLILFVLGLVMSLEAFATGEEGLESFIKRGARYKDVVSLPRFEQNTNEIRAALQQTMAEGNSLLDRVGALNPRRVTFANTVLALDDLGYRNATVANRFALTKETSTSADVREAATAALKELQEWMVGLDYREDVYRSLKAYAGKKPRLNAEDAKLLSETMRDYRRAGLELSRFERDRVETLRKELARLSTDFESNVTKAQKALRFTRAELEGVPDDFLGEVKTGDDAYTVMANVTWHYVTVMENARREETRKKLQLERNNLARAENLPLLEKIVVVRDDIARRLGYRSWADYQTETKMAKSAGVAWDFLQELKCGLQTKYDAEIEEYRRLKAKDTGKASPEINIWDWRYYSNQLKKEKYNVDAEQLRVYFPYQRVLEGMFGVYQKIFGLKFEQVEAPWKWIGDLQLYAVSDAKTGEPLGLFYLDMFPREGKFNHFAVFSLIEGRRLADGTYQRPVCAMVCNFPAPAKDRPSLMTHGDVETIFHEFGHAMHSILTKAKYGRFSGTSVPRDFVEAPSQMLENWVWDKKVLDSFAADYRDPAKKIPADILAKLKESRLVTEGTRYRRQLSFGLLDLRLHMEVHASNAGEILPLSNRILGEAFFPRMPDTAFVAYFGHLVGYDAGYYGYAWADAIAADMATVFEHSGDGYFDAKTGMKLRKEIYEVGDSRDVEISVEKFLGRKRSLEPFLQKIGIRKAGPDAQ